MSSHLTEKTYRALSILRDHGPMIASDFGDRMWPDHPGHTQRSKQGHGTCIGKKIWMMAGGYLGRLHKRKLVKYVFGRCPWAISTEGRRTLMEVKNV